MSDSAPADPFAHAVFRPDSFFLEPFRGWGVTCDAKGRVTGRFETQGSGRLDVRARCAWVEQAVTFDDGRLDAMKWEIVSDEDGHYVGTEHVKNLRADGRLGPDGFCWGFKAPIPGGRRRMHVRVDYTMLTPHVAFSTARATWARLHLGTTTTFYQHVAA